MAPIAVDPWIRIITIVLGLLSCFYGYPLFRAFLVVAGLFYGYVYGQAFFPTSHPLVSILVSIGAAVLFALLAYPLWSFGVVAVGAALGFLILGQVALAFNLPQFGVILVGIVGGVILGFFFFNARDLFVMVATAYNGAVQTIYGLGLLSSAFIIGPGKANFLAVLGIVVLGTLGFAVQYNKFKGQRRYST